MEDSLCEKREKRIAVHYSSLGKKENDNEDKEISV